jgi:hypothetical protein
VAAATTIVNAKVFDATLSQDWTSVRFADAQVAKVVAAVRERRPRRRPLSRHHPTHRRHRLRAEVRHRRGGRRLRRVARRQSPLTGMAGAADSSFVDVNRTTAPNRQSVSRSFETFKPPGLPASVTTISKAFEPTLNGPTIVKNFR